MENSDSFVCLPLLLFEPGAVLASGNPTCSCTPPHPHIQVSCSTTHYFLNVFDEVTPVKLLRKRTDPMIFSSICVQSAETFQEGAKKLLSDWKLPGFSHQSVIRMILSAIGQTIEQFLHRPPSDRDQRRGVPLPRVRIYSLKFYPQDMALFNLWAVRKLREREESTRFGMVGASPCSIESLKREKTTSGDESTDAAGNMSCPICLNDFPAESQVTCMPCSHRFHEGCIMRWLHGSRYCPLCRFELPADELSGIKCRFMKGLVEVLTFSERKLDRQANYTPV